jgi:hypothetical protein
VTRPFVALLCALALAACTSPRLDAPGSVRKPRVPLDPFLAPIFDYESSDSGDSYSWSALLWMVGQDVEGETRKTHVFPLWWHTVDPPYYERSFLFPVYYARVSEAETTRFFWPLYGYTSSENERSDWLVPPLFNWKRSRTEDVYGSSLLLIYDWQHQYDRTSFMLLPLLGFAHLFKAEWGLPAEGETVGALGRSSSRRFDILNLLGIINLFGYDDVGDRREIRFLTLFSNEAWSPLRSWRGRGDDPFVREWAFPLYMNMQDEEDGWFYVGPLWGRRSDRQNGTETDWWLLGLFSRKQAPEGVSWSILGFTVSEPERHVVSPEPESPTEPAGA